MTGKYIRRKLKKANNRIELKKRKILFKIRGFFISLFVSRLDFSVISNNCRGGWVYRILKTPYLSPTAGLFFMAEFAKLPFDNKILINNRKDKKYDCEIYAHLESDEYGIINDTQPFPGKVNIIKILNKNRFAALTAD